MICGPGGPDSPSANAGSVTVRTTVLRMWAAADGLAKRLIAIALSLVLWSSILTALSPAIMQHLIDRLNQDGATGVTQSSALLIMLYTASRWLAKIIRELQEMFLSRCDQRLNRRLSAQYFQHLVSLPLNYHLERRTGALSQTLTNGLIGYRIILQHLVNSILPLAIEFVAMAIILVLLHQAVFLAIAVISLACYIAAFRFGANAVSRPARDVSLAHVDSGAVFADSIMNLEAIKYFCAEFRVSRRFNAALRKTEGCWRHLFARKLENGIVVGCIFGATLLVSVLVAAANYYAGQMTIGEFVLVNSYILQLVRPIEAVGFALRDIAQGRAFIGKMTELLEAKAEAPLPFGVSDSKAFEGELAFENVSLGYDSHRFVLRGLNLIIRPGTTVAIVGRSGSGKSSIVRLLTRLLEPTEGSIRLGGIPLSNLSPAALRDAMGIVPQDIFLFNDSIAYNIGLGKRRGTKKDIVAAARIAGLHDLIAGLPLGYETRVGEHGLRLSGGERQRLAIARAAIRQAKIYIFDEATSSLDSETEREIVRSLAGLSKDATTIVITHRMGSVVHADEIIVLEEGVIVERGTHQSLLKQDRLYAAMWRMQNRDPHSTFGVDARLAG